MERRKLTMNVIVYDHRSGLSVVPDDLLHGVTGVINEITPRIKKNTITEIREKIVSGLELLGWSGEYRLDVSSKITITSYQSEIGLCLQTGNVGRIYSDLLKLQTLFTKGNIKAGIIVLPSKSLAVKVASNMANYERLIGELPIFSQVISIPLVIIGFNAED